MEKLRLDRGQIEVVDNAMAEVLRQKTPTERIRIGFNMWTAARKMLLVHLKETYPEWEDGMIKKEAARRLSHGFI